jgi:hypothetical protein
MCVCVSRGQNYYKKRGLGPDGTALPSNKRALTKTSAKGPPKADHYVFSIKGEEIFHNGRYRVTGNCLGKVQDPSGALKRRLLPPS